MEGEHRLLCTRHRCSVTATSIAVVIISAAAFLSDFSIGARCRAESRDGSGGVASRKLQTAQPRSLVSSTLLRPSDLLALWQEQTSVRLRSRGAREGWTLHTTDQLDGALSAADATDDPISLQSPHITPAGTAPCSCSADADARPSNRSHARCAFSASVGPCDRKSAMRAGRKDTNRESWNRHELTRSV